MTVRAWAVGTVALVAGCGSSASVEGGFTTSPRKEPAGAVTAKYRVSGCRDAADFPNPSPGTAVRVVRDRDGHSVLLESKEGSDTLVVKNDFPRDSRRIYQAVLERKSGRRTLREYRIPERGPGELVLARDFSVTDREGGFEATYHAAALTCALEPLP